MRDIWQLYIKLLSVYLLTLHCACLFFYFKCAGKNHNNNSNIIRALKLIEKNLLNANQCKYSVKVLKSSFSFFIAFTSIYCYHFRWF